MKRFSILAVAVFVAGALPAPAQDTGWKDVDQVFGQAGKDLPGDVHRFGWPRSDLKVQVGTVAVEPAFGLGSWAAFKRTGWGNEAMTMGDLVLSPSEVDPVIGQLHAGGFEILALHNHLSGESPQVLYLHFHGHGNPADLAKTLEAALRKTGTPAPSGRPPAAPDEAQKAAFDKVEQALGRKGTMAGTVLQVGVPRAEPIRDGSLEIPASMGMANALNFETVGSRVATTGDFVLVADEVNPVIRELRAHGIAVTAIHSHMLRETPRLFFMHFWGVDSPEKIGEALKAALAKVATR
jgi:uncharacterized protein DUF1259